MNTLKTKKDFFNYLKEHYGIKKEMEILPQYWSDISAGKDSCPELLKNNDVFIDFLKYFADYVDWEYVIAVRNLPENEILKYKNEIKKIFNYINWENLLRYNKNIQLSENFISNFKKEFINTDTKLMSSFWIKFVLKSQNISENFIKKTFFNDRKYLKQFLKYSLYLKQNPYYNIKDIRRIILEAKKRFNELKKENLVGD